MSVSEGISLASPPSCISSLHLQAARNAVKFLPLFPCTYPYGGGGCKLAAAGGTSRLRIRNSTRVHMAHSKCAFFAESLSDYSQRFGVCTSTKSRIPSAWAQIDGFSFMFCLFRAKIPPRWWAGAAVNLATHKNGKGNAPIRAFAPVANFVALFATDLCRRTFQSELLVALWENLALQNGASYVHAKTALFHDLFF